MSDKDITVATLSAMEIKMEAHPLRTVTGMMETMAGLIAEMRAQMEDLTRRVQELERVVEDWSTREMEASERDG
jgi:hypothetical protein